MSIFKITLALLLISTCSPNVLADTLYKLTIVNNTFSTLKLKQHNGLGLEGYPALTNFNVGPGYDDSFTVKYDRSFTYPKTGWQTVLKKVAPINNFIEYEVNGFRCRLTTSMTAPSGFGLIEPTYKPSWTQASSGRGDAKYNCSSHFAEKQSKVPFNYEVVLTINQPDVQ